MDFNMEVNIVKRADAAKRFIKNPLPLPKKHIHKIQDYAFEPAADKMKFDIEIADDIDYDR